MLIWRIVEIECGEAYCITIYLKNGRYITYLQNYNIFITAKVEKRTQYSATVIIIISAYSRPLLNVGLSETVMVNGN